MLKGIRTIRNYRLSPNVYIETFAEDAVLLIADYDYMITLNHAGAQLFEKAREAIGDASFSRADCVSFLLDHYELTSFEAEQKMRSIIGFGLTQHMIKK